MELRNPVAALRAARGYARLVELTSAEERRCLREQIRNLDAQARNLRRALAWMTLGGALAMSAFFVVTVYLVLR